MKKTVLQKILLIMMILSLAVVSDGATRYKWITIGSLQNFFYDTGTEHEVVAYYQQQWGFTWDSFYRDQDMQAAKGMWIGVRNFFDPVQNTTYAYKIAHNGQRAVTDVEIREYMPQGISLVAPYNHPEVYVDDNEGSDMMNGNNGKNDDIDEINPSLSADRVCVNIVNTSVGITFTRKIYAVSQQNYDDILISEFEFENTVFMIRQVTFILKPWKGSIFIGNGAMLFHKKVATPVLLPHCIAIGSQIQFVM